MPIYDGEHDNHPVKIVELGFGDVAFSVQDGLGMRGEELVPAYSLGIHAIPPAAVLEGLTEQQTGPPAIVMSFTDPASVVALMVQLNQIIGRFERDTQDKQERASE